MDASHGKTQQSSTGESSVHSEMTDQRYVVILMPLLTDAFIVSHCPTTSDKTRYVTHDAVAEAPDGHCAHLPQYAAGVMRCTALCTGSRDSGTHTLMLFPVRVAEVHPGQRASSCPVRYTTRWRLGARADAPRMRSLAHAEVPRGAGEGVARGGGISPCTGARSSILGHPERPCGGPYPVAVFFFAFTRVYGSCKRSFMTAATACRFASASASTSPEVSGSPPLLAALPW